MKKVFLNSLIAVLSISTATSWAQVDANQPELPGLFDAEKAQQEQDKLAEEKRQAEALKAELLEKLAAIDAKELEALKKSNPGLTYEQEKAFTNESYLKNGGYFVATGTSLAESLKNTFFYSSGFQVFVMEPIYSNLKEGLKIYATNGGSSNGYGSISIIAHDSATVKGEDTIKKAMTMAEKMQQTLKSAGYDAAIDPYKFGIALEKGTHSQQVRADLFFIIEKTPELAAKQLESILKELPKPAKSKSSKRAERAAQELVAKDPTKTSAKDAAKKAAKK